HKGSKDGDHKGRRERNDAKNGREAKAQHPPAASPRSARADGKRSGRAAPPMDGSDGDSDPDFDPEQDLDDFDHGSSDDDEPVHDHGHGAADPLPSRTERKALPPAVALYQRHDSLVKALSGRRF